MTFGDYWFLRIISDLRVIASIPDVPVLSGHLALGSVLSLFHLDSLSDGTGVGV